MPATDCTTLPRRGGMDMHIRRYHWLGAWCSETTYPAGISLDVLDFPEGCRPDECKSMKNLMFMEFPESHMVRGSRAHGKDHASSEVKGWRWAKGLPPVPRHPPLKALSDPSVARSSRLMTTSTSTRDGKSAPRLRRWQCL